MSNYILINDQLVEVSDDELKHYGVVGMKWGHRKAQMSGKTYTYTSFGTKRYKRIADRAAKRGNTVKQKKYEQYHQKSVELDRKMQNNALSNSAGKAFIKTLLNTPTLGGRTYEATKAAFGASKNTSRIAAYAMSYFTGPFGASPVRALYVRGHLD